ncbi:MAG: alpha/beta fold hydrolase [Caldilineaceae bacterium]|nr:alpha/beta fold hydrolase [Caldilineaceae bacterium]MBP8106430.1 alpha/beta fold hydrolase [Caldilineaceae bacterium]MBP8123580.1 alpha/beta fold hydrolase [Caldilineaceae bacterium]MBP9072041.1 alpha/beta fold hydrolase [Caldilineaceae bacterium]
MPTAHVNGLDLFYEEIGSGPPLLLIHGLGSSSRDWELQTQTPLFAATHRVIICDVRGHGRSAKPPGPYSVRLFAADVAALLRHLETGPATVVGISMGGMIAFQLAVDAPDLVARMVIVNSGPALVLHTWGDRFKAWQRLALVQFLGMGGMARFLAPRLFPRPDQETIRRTFIQRWLENDHRAYVSALRALLGWSVVAHLSEIRCPILVIAADQDYTPVAVKAAYVAQLPQAKLIVIPDSRHATPVDQPEAFNQAVLAFLAC